MAENLPHHFDIIRACVVACLHSVTHTQTHSHTHFNTQRHEYTCALDTGTGYVMYTPTATGQPFPFGPQLHSSNQPRLFGIHAHTHDTRTHTYTFPSRIAHSATHRIRELHCNLQFTGTIWWRNTRVVSPLVTIPGALLCSTGCGRLWGRVCCCGRTEREIRDVCVFLHFAQ